MGADGGIGTFYNVVSEWFVGIHRLAGEGKWDEARVLQGKVNAVIELGLQFPAPAAAKEMKEVPCGDCRAPRANLTAEPKRTLRAKLDEMDLPQRRQLIPVAVMSRFGPPWRRSTTRRARPTSAPIPCRSR